MDCRCGGRDGTGSSAPDIEAGLRKIGPIVDPACTAKLYRPLMPANDVNSKVTPLYAGITIARDRSFGSHPKDLLDVFTADKGGRSRPVLIYIPGGGGNKTEQQAREANAFYDNIGRWATKNGMVAVLMQRHPGANWDDPARDVSALIQWVEGNIGKYKGNPERMFIWAHSAGNGPLGTYIGRPQLWGPKGVGVKGAIFMSGQWNVAPLEIPGTGGRGAQGAAFAGAGSTCGADQPGASLGIIAGPQRSESSRSACRPWRPCWCATARGCGHATGAFHSAGIREKRSRDAVRFRGTRSRSKRRHERVLPGLARRALQERSESLPGVVAGKRRESHVRGLLDRHRRQNRFRAHPGVDEKSKVTRVAGGVRLQAAG
ncbi:MAG: carboxylesterase family protein [Acidobacteriota bacterium]|nr:carboxylesterase family protein [Acidobacteriota bacterium]